MKTFVYPITEMFGKGLVPNKNVRNNPFLVECLGAFPFEGVLQVCEQFSRIDTSSLGTLTFPYPQLFVLDEVTIVCTPTAIYEYSGGSLTSKISGLTSGVTWSCVDFKTFIYLTNGQQAVTKSPTTGIYSVDATVPYGTCLCNYNGRVLVGSPNTPATGNI